MEQICGIYSVTNNINQKKYIGLSKDIYRRWGEHKRVPFNPQSKEYNYPLYNAIRKYGLENFTFEIIEQCTLEDVKEREKYWIKYYDTIKNGYNITEGGEINCLAEEEHPNAKLTKDEVIFCRKEYAKGSRSREIYDKYFSERLTYSGFQRMWLGYSWSKVMPEVFNEDNPHSRQKMTGEDAMDIRTKFLSGVPIKEIYKNYEKYSYATVLRTIHKKDFLPEYWPDIEDNHTYLNKKLTREDILLIRKMKAEGFKHKEIRAALNNKVSMTTISDVVTGKRHSDVV